MLSPGVSGHLPGSAAKKGQEFSRAEDFDSHVIFDCLQAFVTGDDHFCFKGDGTRNELVVGWILTDNFSDLPSSHTFNGSVFVLE